jgi:hypothetical protein
MQSQTNTHVYTKRCVSSVSTDDPLVNLAENLMAVYSKATVKLGGKEAVRAAVERFYAAETVQGWGKDVLEYLDSLENGTLETVDYWKRYTAIDLGDLLSLWQSRGRFEPDVYWSDGIRASDTQALANRVMEVYRAVAADNESTLEALKYHFSDVCCAGDKAMEQALAAMERDEIPRVEDLDADLQNYFDMVVIRIGNVLFNWQMEGAVCPNPWWANDL